MRSDGSVHHGTERAVSGKAAGWKSYDVEGYEVLVGKGARENDQLTFRVAAPHDLWLHAAGHAGSHVVIRNPDKLPSLPREVVEVAAQLAVHHSKARDAGGKVEVHVCRASDVSKPRGFAAGKVVLRRFDRVRVYSRNPFPD
jgi:predicted ribosome quality control (RQC) complex YloA/Tae2 family protein